MLGWDAGYQESLEILGDEKLKPARVIVAHREHYTVHDGEQEAAAALTGRLRHHTLPMEGFPVVGDWVAVTDPTGTGALVIHAVLPRRSHFSRNAAGQETRQQVLAANVDTVLITTALDHDFNPRRLERYAAMAWSSGAQPVILLTKTDCCPSIAQFLAEAREAAPGMPVHAVSAVSGQGLEALEVYLQPGATVALLGSSGVGKSTLLNRLLGREVQATVAVRQSDARGRHTTTHRELFFLPGGAMVIDTPGLRELQLWDPGEGVAATFEDIEALAEDCRFRDCTHCGEPGCAVAVAIESGELSEARLKSYRALQREQDYAARRLDERLQREHEERWKNIAKWNKKYNTNR